MSSCHRCQYAWTNRANSPKACPRCKIRLDSKISTNSSPLLPAGNFSPPKRPIPYSQLLDKDRDIFKLTRTPKALVEAAIAQIREVYEPDIAEEIIQTAMENKKKFAEEQK